MTWRRRAALAAFGLTAGCATASPILAPARVLPAEKVELDLGTALVAPVGTGTLDEARQRTASNEQIIRSAVAYAMTPPGVVPYFSGRAGLGHGAEGSLALIGRTVRIGARRELVRDGDFTLSAGLAGRFAFIAGALDGLMPDFVVQRSSVYGGELSLVAGITRSRIYDVWLGLRGGYQRSDATVQATAIQPLSFDLGAHRVEAAAAFGLRVGFGRLSAAIEIDLRMAWSVGGRAGESVDALTWALVPAGAISWRL
ncbi:MAG: hypothetical protein IPN17_02715 [Deltaproteobacteria bacterium]|nr:hypothetical protein [Deltaproteobacteria bacterium]